MNILHTIPILDLTMGGSVHAAINLCRTLRVFGQSAHLAGTYRGSEPAPLEGISSTFFQQSFPTRYSNSWPLRRWLNANIRKFQVVEIHGVFSMVSLMTASASRKARVPYIVRPHGSLDPFDLIKHRLLKRMAGPVIFRPMLENAARIHLTARLEAERLVTFGGKVKCTVIPLPVQEVQAPASMGNLRSSLGIPENALVVLFLSRIDYKKGLEFLIPSLATLKARCRSLWFILAGAGESKYVGKIRSLINQHKMRAWTTECGFVSGQMKADVLQCSDIFALPSLNENFGISIVEAMQAGLPVIVSDQVYIHKEIRDGGAGLTCKPETESVTAALGHLLFSASFRQQMGLAARRLAKEVFSAESASRELIHLYHNVVAGC